MAWLDLARTFACRVSKKSSTRRGVWTGVSHQTATHYRMPGVVSAFMTTS
jgi:hypothetical protein